MDSFIVAVRAATAEWTLEQINFGDRKAWCSRRPAMSVESGYEGLAYRQEPTEKDDVFATHMRSASHIIRS